MSDITLIPDHRQRALDALLSRYRGRPRITALIGALALGVQTVEADLHGLVWSATLDAAIGAHLDQWGALVDEKRAGLDDPDYLVFIKARIQVNICKGDTDAHIRIWQTLTAPSTVYHRWMYPAGYIMHAYRSELMDDRRAARVGRMMRDCKPGGITMRLIEASAGYYAFDGDAGGLGLDGGRLARRL